MDLSTIISRIDLHQYGTAKEFLHEVDLIWQNALEYNPDRDPSGRKVPNPSQDNCSHNILPFIIQ